ncbi:hypothetical protein NDU88_004523 [Pleurodeles waltl]|uniref:Uncharacterized protein n=1 Tax=Pleurodeles waltl TaxID=8319 RepID=A0AAV7RLK3_PLEWA|nr:hypothetical protein NDU88_004523 [Pleurodeles waltl]
MASTASPLAAGAVTQLGPSRGAVLTVVFATGVSAPRRRAGRLALGEYEVPAPCFLAPIMSKSGERSAVGTYLVLEQERLETYRVPQLKEFKCPFKGLTGKEELKKVLRAWLVARKASEHTEDDNDVVEEDEQNLHLGWLEEPASPVRWEANWNGGRTTPKAGSSVSSPGLSRGAGD